MSQKTRCVQLQEEPERGQSQRDAWRQYPMALGVMLDERPIIFYDQLGGGKADRPDDPSLWRIERFVQEVAKVRKALGLKEVHPYGHSWGTMLATDYILTGPTGIKSLILASPCLSAKRWVEDADKLIAELPPSVFAGSYGSSLIDI